MHIQVFFHLKHFSITFGSFKNHSTFSVSEQEKWMYYLFTNINHFSLPSAKNFCSLYKSSYSAMYTGI